jgi:hypothetical protein
MSEEEQNPLTELKATMKQALTDLLDFLWPEVEAAIKRSYYNGVEAGKKKEAPTTETKRPQFGHRKE